MSVHEAYLHCWAERQEMQATIERFRRHFNVMMTCWEEGMLSWTGTGERFVELWEEVNATAAAITADDMGEDDE